MMVVYFLVGFCIVPAAFLGFCYVAYSSGARSWWSYVTYFIFFGSVGAWCLAMGLMPSPLLPLVIFFTLVITPVACLLAALVQTFRKRHIWCDTAILISCYLYTGVMLWWWLHRGKGQ